MGNRRVPPTCPPQHGLSVSLKSPLCVFSVRISVVKNSHVSVVINNNIRVMMLLHRVWKKHPVNVDFLGVYVDNNNLYSPLVHGLIGTYVGLYSLDVNVSNQRLFSKSDLQKSVAKGTFFWKVFKYNIPI